MINDHSFYFKTNAIKSTTEIKLMTLCFCSYLSTHAIHLKIFFPEYVIKNLNQNLNQTPSQNIVNFKFIHICLNMWNCSTILASKNLQVIKN